MGTRNFKDSPGAKVGKESFEQTSERRKRRDKRKEEEERAQRHALFKRGDLGICFTEKRLFRLSLLRMICF